MDWFPNFFWTPAELALAVPVGVILAGVISYFGARKGSKDLAKVQDKVIQSQKDLAEMQREHALFDKQADAYVEMFRVLQTMPGMPDAGEGADFARFTHTLVEWNLSFQRALAPLMVFSDPALYPKIKPFTTYITEACNTTIAQIGYMIQFSEAHLVTGQDDYLTQSNAAGTRARDSESKMAQNCNELRDIIRGELFPEDPAS